VVIIIELRQLKTFCVIAETGSFTKAAGELGYAQSSITAQIQALEEELGTKLFERLGRNVTLSRAGDRFLLYARQITRLTAEAAAAVVEGETAKGTLVIGAPESLCVYRLPPIIGVFRKRYPEVEIIVRVGSCSDFLTWLKNSEIDAAFLIGREVSFPNIAMEVLIDEPIAVLSGKDHPLVPKGSVTPEDIQGECMILTEGGLINICYRAVFEDILLQNGIQPKTVLEYGSVEAIKKCVINRLGITVLPYVAVAEELKKGELVDLNWQGPDFLVKTQLMVHKNKWLSSSLVAFMDLTRKMIDKI
jgi:DNA-binding transcriptional LysR family regulator